MKKIIAGAIFAVLFFATATIYGCTSCSYTPDESSGDITEISEASKEDAVSNDVGCVSKDDGSSDESNPENVSENASDETSDEVSEDTNKPDESSNTTSEDSSAPEVSDDTSKDVSAPETSNDTSVDVSKPEESEVSKEEKPPVETSKDTSDVSSPTVKNDTTAPTLMVSTPETTSASNPTYTTNDFYVVEGGVYDAKGVKSVTVNGVAATFRKNGDQWLWSATVSGLATNTATKITIVATDNAGNTTTEIRYVYYNKPAANEKACFAVFSADDNSLTFYNRTGMAVAGAVYNGKVATEVYTGFDAVAYSSASEVPWYSIRRTIKLVKVEDKISPISTAYWFYQLNNCDSIDVRMLDTQNVTDMRHMFNGAGQKSTVFNLDLSNWNTSSVTNMSHMFIYAGRNSTTFSLNLSGWDVSNVTDMICMFRNSGQKAGSWIVAGFADWNVSRVTNMEEMFAEAGRDATTFTITGLENWETSSVTNVSSMFALSGQEASYSLDLSGWDVTNVTSFDSFNGSVEDKVTAPNFK